MLSDNVIEFHDVWKKYSKQQVLHNLLREELLSLFSSRRGEKGLQEGEFWALQNIDLRIRRGECIGLQGPNGSGKSTLLKLMSNITFPTEGAVKIQERVAPLIELGAGFHPDLSGMENIYMNASILGLTIKEIKHRVNSIVDFSELQSFIHAPVKKYSSGMYLRLAFSIAIQSPAKIFLFDEILAVGDESFQKKCGEKMIAMKNAGKTIIIVSHDTESLKKYCHRIVHLSEGRILTI